VNGTTPRTQQSLPDWGLLPADVKAHFQHLEWHNERNLRDRLAGIRTVALKIGLRPPNGRQALADLDRFNHYINTWQRWPNQQQLSFETKKYRQIGEQRVPVKLELSSVQELFALIGEQAVQRSEQWQASLKPFIDFNRDLYTDLVYRLEWLEQLSENDIDLLIKLLQQLKPGMGRGLYLRALPLQGVHTKFIEMHEEPLLAMLQTLHPSTEPTEKDIRDWLGCTKNPNNFVTIRALCNEARIVLGGFPVIKIDSTTLSKMPLPANRIIMVENEQSIYCLPQISDTVAVMSGGNNLTWLQNNQWLSQKALYYWGDIDSWGFQILNRARAAQPHMVSLMMDEETIRQYEHLMVKEPVSSPKSVSHLTQSETIILLDLLRDRFSGNRLEQERLPADYVNERIIEIS
jgi:hypothetical protein